MSGKQFIWTVCWICFKKFTLNWIRDTMSASVINMLAKKEYNEDKEQWNFGISMIKTNRKQDAP